MLHLVLLFNTLTKMANSKIYPTTVMVIDGGGRGHALIKAYAKSSSVDRLIAIPGNDFMQRGIDKPVVTFQGLTTTSIDAIAKIAKDEHVTLADVAQDNAIEAGVADMLRKLHPKIAVVGPNKLAGQVEWDKGWFREKAKLWGVPQPEFSVWTSAAAAKAYIESVPDRPRYIKDPYLAGGKGALSARNNAEALERIDQHTGAFNHKDGHIVIEDWLLNDDGALGEEFSSFILSDGSNFQLVGYAQDYKRALNSDKGEQTGSMGSAAPTNLVSEKDSKYILDHMAKPIIEGLKKMRRPYIGMLYLSGIKIMAKGKPVLKVIEVNARWGDPEAEVIVSSITNDFFELNMAVAKGKLNTVKIKTDNKRRIVITLAPKGYPASSTASSGKEIYGIEEAEKVDGVTIYGAGIQQIGKKFVIKSGRVLYVMGEGCTMAEAKKKAYKAAKQISGQDNSLFMRDDIGRRDIKREEVTQ